MVESWDTLIRKMIQNINDAIHAFVRLDFDLWILDDCEGASRARILYLDKVSEMVAFT